MKTKILLSLLAAPLAMASPFEPRKIPAEANWFLHGDLSALRDSEAGGFLIKVIRKEQANALAEIKNIFEFDPLTDLTDLTLFGSGREGEGAVILSGKIDRGHVEEVIGYADAYEKTTYNSTTIHHWDDKGKRQHAAFHGNRTVIITSQEDLLQLALDVLGGRKPGLERGPALSTEGAAIVAFGNVSEIEMPVGEGSRIVKRAKSLAVTLGEKDDRVQLGMVAETDSAGTATRLGEVMVGLVSLGELADDKIESLEIKHDAGTEGSTMMMTMSLSVPKALAILAEMK